MRTPSTSQHEHGDRADDTTNGSVWPRRLLIGLGVIALLLAGAGVTAKAIFTPERLNSMVVPRLEQAAGRDVRVSTVKLDLLPRPAVRLEDFSLAAAPGFGPEPALSGEAVDLQFALLPLLRGRVTLKRLRLVAPTVRYLVARDGSHSFGGLGGETAEESARPGKDDDAVALPVSNFAVERGTVLYDDRKEDRGARFLTNGTFSASLDGGAPPVISSQGELRIGSLRAMLPELREDSLRIEAFRLTYDGRLDPAADSLNLRSLGLEVDEVRFSGHGSLAWGGETPRARLRMETGETEIGALRRMVPGLDLDELDPRGTLQLTARVEGPLGGGGTPDVSGEARVSSFGVDYADVRDVIDGATATVTFAGDSVRVTSFEGSVLGRPLRGELELARGDPQRVRGQLSGEIDLERLSRVRIRLAEDSEDPDAVPPRPMSGTATVELTFRGTTDDLSGLTVRGPVRLSGFSYETPSLAAPLQIASGTVRFTGSGLETRELGLRVGETDLTFTADARDVLPLSRLDRDRRGAGARPTLDFRLESDRIQLDQLFPGRAEGDTGPTYSQVLKAHLSGEQVSDQRPEDIAADRYPLPGLPELNAQGEVRVGELVNPPTRLEDLTFTVQLEDGRLRVRDVRAGLYGGRLTGGVSAEVGSDDRRSPVRFDVDLQGSDAAAFMDRWTELEKALTGTLDISIAGRTFFDQTLLPVTERTDAEGRLMVRDGSMEGMVPMQGVVRAVGVSSAEISRFDSLGGPFRVRQGRLELLDWRLDSRSGADGQVAGSVAFAGPLDLDMTLSVPLSMLQGSRLMQLGGGEKGMLSRILGDAAGGDEIIDIPVSVGGTMSNPAVKVDERAFAAGLRKLLQGRDGARGLLQRLLGGGDEEKEDGGFLERMLKGKKDTASGGNEDGGG